MKNKLSVVERVLETPEEAPMEPQDKYFVYACLVIGLLALLLGSCTGQP